MKLVTVTDMQVAQLGIPRRSLRDPLDDYRCTACVDARRLKRMRAKVKRCESARDFAPLTVDLVRRAASSGLPAMAAKPYFVVPAAMERAAREFWGESVEVVVQGAVGGWK